MVDNFNRIKAIEDGSSTMTDGQTQWVHTMKAMMGQKAKIKPQPEGCLGRFVHSVIADGPGSSTKSRPAAYVVNTVLLINILLELSRRYEMSAESLAALEQAINVCTSFFILEVVAKVLAFGRRVYLRDSWRRFELALLLPPLIEIIDASLATTTPRVWVNAVRAANVLRVLRLLQEMKAVRAMLTTVLLAIPSLSNVATMLLLFVYIYAVLGMQLFTFVKHQHYLSDARKCDLRGFQLIRSAQTLLFSD